MAPGGIFDGVVGVVSFWVARFGDPMKRRKMRGGTSGAE